MSSGSPYCCRCFGCDGHQHVCGLPLDQAERYRSAHEAAIGGTLRELYDEGFIELGEDGVLRLSTER